MGRAQFIRIIRIGIDPDILVSGLVLGNNCVQFGVLYFDCDLSVRRCGFFGR